MDFRSPLLLYDLLWYNKWGKVVSWIPRKLLQVLQNMSQCCTGVMTQNKLLLLNIWLNNSWKWYTVFGSRACDWRSRLHSESRRGNETVAAHKERYRSESLSSSTAQPGSGDLGPLLRYPATGSLCRWTSHDALFHTPCRCMVSIHSGFCLSHFSVFTLLEKAPGVVDCCGLLLI